MKSSRKRNEKEGVCFQKGEHTKLDEVGENNVFKELATKKETQFFSPSCLLATSDFSSPSSPSSSCSDRSQSSSGYESLLCESFVEAKVEDKIIRENKGHDTPARFNNFKDFNKSDDDDPDDSLVNYNFRMYPSMAECLSDKITSPPPGFCNFLRRDVSSYDGKSSLEYKQFEEDHLQLQNSSTPHTGTKSFNKFGPIKRPDRISFCLEKELKAYVDKWVDIRYGQEVMDLINYVYAMLADSKKQRCIQHINSCSTADVDNFSNNSLMTRNGLIEFQKSSDRNHHLWKISNTAPIDNNVNPNSNFGRRPMPPPNYGHSSFSAYQYGLESVIQMQWQNRMIARESLYSCNFPMPNQYENIWMDGTGMIRWRSPGCFQRTFFSSSFLQSSPRGYNSDLKF